MSLKTSKSSGAIRGKNKKYTDVPILADRGVGGCKSNLPAVHVAARAMRFELRFRLFYRFLRPSKQNSDHGILTTI